MTFEEALERAKSGEITRDDALSLFQQTENYAKAADLFKVAGMVRDDERGIKFKIAGGIATILPCRLNPMCSYCGYFVGQRAPLTLDEILRGVKYIEEHGIRDFHLSGGTTLHSSGEEVVRIVRAIRSVSKSELTVNVGAGLSVQSLMELKKLGVGCITCAFETANRDLFRELKPGDSFEAKEELAKMVESAGLSLGSGLLAGLKLGPSRYEDYVDFFFHLKRFKNLNIVYVSRFHPYPGTPMENHPVCSSLEGARVIAVMRLVLRNIDIRMANGWSYEDIPIWVMAGGGIQVVGVHINRAPHDQRNRYPSNVSETIEGVQYNNTIDTSTRFLLEAGMSVGF